MIARARSPKDPAIEVVSINPATLEELGRFPASTASAVNAAVARARTAQLEWGALSIRNRARYILKLQREVYDRQNEIVSIISDETGKPRFEALTSEVFPACDLMSHFAANAARILRDQRFSLAVFRNKRSMITHQPLGVVGIISPWNFPFSIPMGSIVMALVAGNTVVFKPSEHTPLVADLI